MKCRSALAPGTTLLNVYSVYVKAVWIASGTRVTLPKEAPKRFSPETSSFSSQKVTLYAVPATVGRTWSIKPSLLTGPVCNEKLPVCGFVLLTLVNVVSPLFIQGGKLPVSKLPLTTMQAPGVAVGVGAVVVPVVPPHPATITAMRMMMATGKWYLRNLMCLLLLC